MRESDKKKSAVIEGIKDKINAGLGQAVPSRIHESAGCDNVYIPNIEERLDRMEWEAKGTIEQANNQLAKVARIRAALKKNPALSDLYSLLRF